MLLIALKKTKKITQEFGADTIDFLKCDITNKIKELTDGRGADVVLEVRNNSNQIFRDFIIDLKINIYIYIFRLLVVLKHSNWHLIFLDLPAYYLVLVF